MEPEYSLLTGDKTRLLAWLPSLPGNQWYDELGIDRRLTAVYVENATTQETIMAEFPNLSEMGINNPGEIEHYSLSTTNNVDHLRIIYKRKKGSLLPTSKRFEFGRASRTVMTDSGTQATESVHDISPFLHKALQ